MNIQEIFKKQLDETPFLDNERLKQMLCSRKESLNDEQYELEVEYLTSKIGKKLLYFLIYLGKFGEGANVNVEMRSIWSDELNILDPLLTSHEQTYTSSGLPRFTPI